MWSVREQRRWDTTASCDEDNMDERKVKWNARSQWVFRPETVHIWN
jgi:hypothetical protein